MKISVRGQVELKEMCDWCRKPRPKDLSDLDLAHRGWLVSPLTLICDEHTTGKNGRKL